MTNTMGKEHNEDRRETGTEKNSVPPGQHAGDTFKPAHPYYPLPPDALSGQKSLF